MSNCPLIPTTFSHFSINRKLKINCSQTIVEIVFICYFQTRNLATQTYMISTYGIFKFEKVDNCVLNAISCLFLKNHQDIDIKPAFAKQMTKYQKNKKEVFLII